MQLPSSTMSIDATASPFEKLFDLTPGSTDQLAALDQPSLVDPATGEIVELDPNANPAELEREERLEEIAIASKLDNIHAKAMQAFEQQQLLSQEVDPKFSARNAEVAAQFLSLAKDAVTARSEAKFKRQKVRIAENKKLPPATVNNNLIVTDRNTLLRDLLKAELQVQVSGAAE